MNMKNMETGPIVVFDNLGRLLIPKKVRDAFNAKKFRLITKDEEMVLRPLKTLDDLFGALPKLSTKGIKEAHEDDEHFT